MNNQESYEKLNQDDANFQKKVERRTVLRGFGALVGASMAGSAFLSEEACAQQRESGLMNRGLTQEELRGTPYVFEDQGPFDMDDPYSSRVATFKITNNLIGAKTYVPMFSRVLIGPQGKAGSVLHGHIGMWTWQLQEPNDELKKQLPKGSFIQRALYTGMILDPQTYQPVETVYNQYLDKHVEVQDSVFSESYIAYPNGVVASIDRPQFMGAFKDEPPSVKAYNRWGDDIAIFLDGIFLNEGPNQPRMDTSTWTTNYADLMNPKKHLVKTDYNFAGLMRAWERPWIGVGKDDDTQLLWNVKGTKLHSVDEMPDLIVKNLIEKYPDRI